MTDVAVGISGGEAVIVSGSFDGTVKVWNAANGKYIQTLRNHVGPVENIDYLCDSQTNGDIYKADNIGSNVHIFRKMCEDKVKQNECRKVANN